MKTQSRAFRTSDWTEGSPSNRTMTLSTQLDWLIDNSVNVLEWPSHSLSLNPIKYFWRNLKMCICPHPTWQSLRGEEMRRRMAEISKWWWSKFVASYPKRFEVVICAKGASTKYWAKAVNTYVHVIFFLLLLLFFLNLQRFQTNLFCVVIMGYFFCRILRKMIQYFF